MKRRGLVLLLLSTLLCCVTVPQRFIDPSRWLKTGRIDASELPIHPILRERMGVGPDPAIGCVPATPSAEEALLERALKHMIDLPGATNCTDDIISASALHADEYCGLGYSIYGMFCTTIPSVGGSIDAFRECLIPSGGVIHLEEGQKTIDMNGLAKTRRMQRGFPMVRYLLHTHPCARTFLSRKDVSLGLVALKYIGEDAKDGYIYTPSVVRYAVSATGEMDLGKPLEGWLRTPDMEFKINLVSGDVWRKKVSRGRAGNDIPWQWIGKCVVTEIMPHADQQCAYGVEPLQWLRPRHRSPPPSSFRRRMFDARTVVGCDHWMLVCSNLYYNQSCHWREDSMAF